MKVISNSSSPEIASVLNAGGIIVMRTDTIYGILARADNRAAVERIFNIKGRDDNKSPIVLIHSPEEMFDGMTDGIKRVAREVWPGKVSVITPSTKAPQWITRGNDSVAYRLADHSELQDILTQTGPLVAPSANPQGLKPATTIAQATEYFGEAIDLYVDGGEVTDNTPSQLLRVETDGTVEKLR